MRYRCPAPLPLALLTVFSISALLSAQAQTPDLVRLGNLKFALYGAVSYMKEACANNLKVEERIFPKGPVAATSRKALDTCKRGKNALQQAVPARHHCQAVPWLKSSRCRCRVDISQGVTPAVCVTRHPMKARRIKQAA